ncbi:MAG: hypothetical protein ACYDFT_03260 [Thermoplasmata archaeon]
MTSTNLPDLWQKRDEELKETLKKLARQHKVFIDPQRAEFYSLFEGLRHTDGEFASVDASRYYELANEAFGVHEELARRSDASAGEDEGTLNRWRQIMDGMNRLADEDAPHREYPESPYMLPLYVIPFLVTLGGLSAASLRPESALIDFLAVGLTDVGFMVGVWGWRVRFTKYPGPRSLWLVFTMLAMGLTIGDVLTIMGWQGHP